MVTNHSLQKPLHSIDKQNLVLFAYRQDKVVGTEVRTYSAHDAAAIRAFDVGRPHCRWAVLKLVPPQPQ